MQLLESVAAEVEPLYEAATAKPSTLAAGKAHV